MKKSNKQFAEALYEVTKGLSGRDLDQALVSFAELLVRSHKLKQADRIIAEYIKYAKQQEGIVEMTVVSTRKLEKHTLDTINKAFGGKAEMKEDLDKALLGGVKIKTGDKIFDGSVKKQLTILKKQLVI